MITEAVEEERAARIAAQTENEALKGKLARSGVEQRRAVRDAVLAEREACAKLCERRADVLGQHIPPGLAADYFTRGAESAARRNAAAIRARGAA